jgi:hypothetical protein
MDAMVEHVLADAAATPGLMDATATPAPVAAPAVPAQTPTPAPVMVLAHAPAHARAPVGDAALPQRTPRQLVRARRRRPWRQQFQDEREPAVAPRPCLVPTNRAVAPVPREGQPPEPCLLPPPPRAACACSPRRPPPESATPHRWRDRAPRRGPCRPGTSRACAAACAPAPPPPCPPSVTRAPLEVVCREPRPPSRF